MPKSKAEKADATLENPHFNNAKTRAILDGLILQKLAGKKAESGFKVEAWNEVTKNYNAMFKCNLNKGQLKNHYQTMKRNYSIVYELRNTSGVGWDEESKMVLAPPEFWGPYSEKHKGAAAYEKKPFPLYDVMNELCGNVNATADGILGTQTSVNPNDNQPASPNPNDNQPASPNPNDNQPAHNDIEADLSDQEDFLRHPPPSSRASGSEIANLTDLLGMDEFNPKDPVNPSHSHHSDDDSDGPITQASTRASSKRASAGKKPPARIRPNTKAKLAAALDNSANILKKDSTEAIDRERLKAKMIADHDLAKERILETSARLERESIAFKLRSAPSQVEAMKIFNASFTAHFTDMVAAAAAIKVFENEDKCQTFINSPDLLRWSWLAGELGFSVVEN